MTFSNKIRNFFSHKPVEIWKTEKEEFLRKEKKLSGLSTYDFYDYYDVYAIHQVSITTGNKRILEDWRLA